MNPDAKWWNRFALPEADDGRTQINLPLPAVRLHKPEMDGQMPRVPGVGQLFGGGGARQDRKTGFESIEERRNSSGKPRRNPV
jgi:hypothetical protein